MSALSEKPLPAVAVDVLESLGQHRLLGTRQVHALHTPRTSIRWTQKLLRTLRLRGLVDSITHRGPTRLWFLTPDGAAAVRLLPTREEPRSRATTPEQAAGPLRAHTLAVNDVGVAFVTAARARGDECGPLSWRHEVAHPIGATPGKRGGEQLVADALLSYLRRAGGGVVLEQRFVELDRGTMPVHGLVEKLNRYARLSHYPDPDGSGPLWRRHYSVLPEVLVVFTGQPSGALVSRRQTTIALALQRSQLRSDRGVRVSFCLLDELVRDGPFAPLFLRLAEPLRWSTWLAPDNHGADR